jgi:hypothetical protein
MRIVKGDFTTTIRDDHNVRLYQIIYLDGLTFVFDYVQRCFLDRKEVEENKELLSILENDKAQIQPPEGRAWCLWSGSPAAIPD